MRKVKQVLAFHFEQGRSQRDIARHCGIARRSVALVLERFAASGLSWPEAREVEEVALEEALYPPPAPESPGDGVNWAEIKKALSARGVTLKLLWEEWLESHPDGMSYPTWCRRFRTTCPSHEPTMRLVRRPGERLFVDYSGMTVSMVIDGAPSEAQVFVAAMGVSGLIFARATRTQKVDDVCNAHVYCFEAMGCVPQAVVPDNLKAAVVRASRYEPTLNETYAHLLNHYGTHGLPARVRRPRDKALAETGVLLVQRRVLAPMRGRIFHDLETLNEAIANAVERLNDRPYSDGSGECRRTRFEAIDRPHMHPLPDRRWQRIVWRKNKVHRDYHISIDRHNYSVPFEYIGKEVDVCLRGGLIEVFHKGRQIAVHTRSHLNNHTTTLKQHQPLAHQRAGVEGTRVWLEREALGLGTHVHGFIAAVMARYVKPELSFRACLGVIRLASQYDPDRFEQACRYALELGTDTYRGLDTILKTGADLIDIEEEPEPPSFDHSNIRGPECFR